ncbi:MAG: hypothetical protein WA484_05165 [Solirubrobacteraceae bacterium]
MEQAYHEAVHHTELLGGCSHVGDVVVGEICDRLAGREMTHRRVAEAVRRVVLDDSGVVQALVEGA